MKIALLSGANPNTCKEGPTVRLLPGTWRFHLHGLVDSELAMKVGGYEGTNVIKNHLTLKFDETEQVQLFFSKRGSEQFITAFAERI